MKFVKILRESGFVRDTGGLFKITKEGIFLNLAENKQSEIKLHSNLSFYYQRKYQYNSNTYTQKMIPDIVLEGEARILSLIQNIWCRIILAMPLAKCTSIGTGLFAVKLVKEM